MFNRLTVLLMLLLSAAFVGGRDIYVSLDGTNNPPYTNWPDAATNIEWAVNVGVNGDTVWISNGVYVLTNQVTVNSNLTIRGTDTNNKPVIDGNNSNRCFFFGASAKTGVLANLFIVKGYVNGSGGGVYMTYGTVRDCIFSNNVCTNKGGGIFNNYIGIVQRCIFIDNKAFDGGGLYLDATDGVRIENCSFQTNIAFHDAGGLYCNRGWNNVITGCDFIGNVATNQIGGAYLNFDGRTNNFATHCTFSSNIAVNGNVGGVYVNGGCVLSNSFVSNNIAAINGGGVYAYGSSAQNQNSFIKNCVIARNITQTYGGNYGGGGMYLRSGAVAQDCVIEENRSGFIGGGILFEYNRSIARNCLIRNNVAAYGGGGIRDNSYGSAISSCTIVSNYAGSEAGGYYNTIGSSYTGIIENCIIYFNEAGADSNLYVTSTKSSYSNNCFAPALTGEATNYSANNITANPQFIDRSSGNYRLDRDSPCVNAGVNREWMENAVDLDGYHRLDIYSGIVDIGCYEYMSSGSMFKFH